MPIFCQGNYICFLRLECDQECATLERNRRLAEALQIDTSSESFTSGRSTSVYSSSLKEDARSVFIATCCVMSVINCLFLKPSLPAVFLEKT